MRHLSLPQWIVIGAWAAFILVWAASAFSVKRDIAKFGMRGGWWMRVLAIVALFIVWKCMGRDAPLNLDGAASESWPAFFGAALSAGGVAFAIWARIHLGRNWSPRPALKEGHELVTSGPYRLIRHPIYTGLLAALLGTCIVTPSWAAICIVTAAMFVWRVGVEEDLMVRQFPDAYPAYKDRTWALIPFIY